jgi:hypothetical protein
MPQEKSMENHETLLNSGFSSALPSLILPYLEKATYRRKTTHAFCGEDANAEGRRGQPARRKGLLGCKPAGKHGFKKNNV